MKTQTMTQYLTEIKTIVDHIVAAGSTVDVEDIILYTLNGLPSTYNSFKTANRTSLLPISLEDLYSLLIGEEINLATETTKETSLLQAQQTALYLNKGKKLTSHFKPKHKESVTKDQQRSKQYSNIQCQICAKRGHTTVNCWHRMNQQYFSPKALVSTYQEALHLAI